MPGVLILEALAQAGAFLVNKSDSEEDGRLVYILAIDKARFRKIVEPGDQLVLDVRAIKTKGKLCKVKAEAFVNNQLVTEAEFLAVLVDRQGESLKPENLI